ncbi:deferrochelatase/peroxidase EfeB [Roseiarcus fermentans]|uniref:Deferrochelatase n=1 Tax=Roseiarcus fermentans TaxID=1473586 RepID=A0A366FES1_9HYPH|nr:iron uptake transporter deferrochelatase/peroxidase subunit [Roseiarcus fermentans]RBP13182.1 deferrochelatase/peroxidase EfeB [Roseiarcus fermentans]
MTTTKTPSCPFAASRRGFLLGAGAIAAAGGGAGAAIAAESEAARPQVADAPIAHSDARRRTPFYGVHQAGVVTPRPACGIVAAFDLVAANPEELQTLFRKLTERIAFLTQGGRAPDRDPKLPPADSGILGPVIEPDELTVTVSVGDSLFEDRAWLKPLKPKTLMRMAGFPNDALVARSCHGDVLLQFCANSQPTNIHALRDIIKNTSDSMVLRWRQEGSVPVVPPQPDGKSESARNFLGFRDGSANPDSNDDALMEKIVWVGAGDPDEPKWAHGGSYQVVRLIRMLVEDWDRTPLGEQERIFGREKWSGAPLGVLGGSEHDIPDYAADPKGDLTPLTAHMRLANPRRPETEANLIVRRGFNFSNGVTKSGHLEDGLLFLSYQADLAQGFLAVQSRLNGEPLEEYIKPFGGGYFFVLPGVRDESDYLGRSLIEAIA